MSFYALGDLLNMTVLDLRRLLNTNTKNARVVIFTSNSQSVYEGTFNGISNANLEIDRMKVLSVAVSNDGDCISIHAFDPEMAY